MLSVHQVSRLGYRFCDFLNRCIMPAQTMKAFHANVSPFYATKLVAMATSLGQSSPNFNYRNLFIDDINSIIGVEIRAAIVE